MGVIVSVVALWVISSAALNIAELGREEAATKSHCEDLYWENAPAPTSGTAHAPRSTIAQIAGINRVVVGSALSFCHSSCGRNDLNIATYAASHVDVIEYNLEQPHNSTV